MRTIKEAVDGYYAGWKEGMDWSLFSPDLRFSGPLMTCEGLEEFKQMVKEIKSGGIISDFDIHSQFFKEGENGEPNQACTLFTFHTSDPFESSTLTADFFLFDSENRIAAVEVIYDAREWAKHMETHAVS